MLAQDSKLRNCRRLWYFTKVEIEAHLTVHEEDPVPYRVLTFTPSLHTKLYDVLRQSFR